MNRVIGAQLVNQNNELEHYNINGHLTDFIVNESVRCFILMFEEDFEEVDEKMIAKAGKDVEQFYFLPGGSSQTWPIRAVPSLTLSSATLFNDKKVGFTYIGYTQLNFTQTFSIG